jgi:hypothetical protein
MAPRPLLDNLQFDPDSLSGSPNAHITETGVIKSLPQ